MMIPAADYNDERMASDNGPLRKSDRKARPRLLVQTSRRVKDDLLFVI
jgi:hypothetical protein